VAVFNKVNQFVEDIGLAVHNLSTHTLKVYLVNGTIAATDAVKADAAEIATGSGYTGAVDVQNTWAESAGTATLTGTKVTITASGGNVGPFQQVVLYNEDPTSPADPLIGWWDYGSGITLASGESFAIKFNNSDTTGTIGTFT
jgi:hypothetical protein